MNQELLNMTDKELRQYLSSHRQDEKAFSEALKILISRKKTLFPYPPISEMNYQEIENIFKAKLN